MGKHKKSFKTFILDKFGLGKELKKKAKVKKERRDRARLARERKKKFRQNKADPKALAKKIRRREGGWGKVAEAANLGDDKIDRDAGEYGRGELVLEGQTDNEKSKYVPNRMQSKLFKNRLEDDSDEEETA